MAASESVNPVDLLREQIEGAFAGCVAGDDPYVRAGGDVR